MKLLQPTSIIKAEVPCAHVRDRVLGSPSQLLQGHMEDLVAETAAYVGSSAVTMHMVVWQLLPRS